MKLNQEKQIKEEIVWPSDGRVTNTLKAKVQWRTRQSRGHGPRSTNQKTKMWSGQEYQKAPCQIQRLATSRHGRQKATRKHHESETGEPRTKDVNRQVGHNVPRAESTQNGVVWWHDLLQSLKISLSSSMSRFLKKLTPGQTHELILL